MYELWHARQDNIAREEKKWYEKEKNCVQFQTCVCANHLTQTLSIQIVFIFIINHRETEIRAYHDHGHLYLLHLYHVFIRKCTF